MSDPILTTKFQPPILRQDLVPRARLVERLNAGLVQRDGFVRKLTLVSAPAGFGKTTLASEWLYALTPTSAPAGKREGTRISWLSLDEGDNDPARFLAYLIGTLRTIHPDFARRTEAILHLPQPPPDSVILTSLVNDLSGFPAPFVLALDDYHIIHTPRIHEQLTFILEHQPASMHLVILTREDPLLPVARLRARGQLLEIRQEDLRFTAQEIAEFLRLGAGLALAAEDIIALERHTEGWAVGLQLAALSMRASDDPAGFLRGFAASDRYILDYLIEEVFERQSAEIQDFLLRTSILKRLSGPLCDAVIGRTGSVDVLRSLEQSNLFIVPLDPSRHWYRYHHLFAELLLHRLRLGTTKESELHQRASAWYEAQNLLPDAIEHALVAGDWRSAIRLILAASEQLFKHGESATLLGWFGRLPQDVVCSNAELCLGYVWAALMTSQFDVAAKLLESAEQMAPPGSSELGRVAAAQAFLARSRRETRRAIEKSEQALALLPQVDITNRGNIAMNLGLAYWHEGQLAKAEPVLLQASDLCSRSGNPYSFLTAQLFLARVFASRGQLHRAAAFDEELIRANGQIPILCLAHFDLATIHHEWNDLPKAKAHLEQGLMLSQRSGNLEFQQAGHLLKAIIVHAEGDKTAALAALSEADALARDFPPVIHSRAAALGVQMALAYNDPQMLAQWESQIQAEVDAHLFYRFMGLVRVRLLLFRGKKPEAAAVLNEIQKRAARAGWGYGELVVRLLQSMAASNPDDALTHLTLALRTGSPEGFVRSFMDAGSGMIPLLREAARRGIQSAYVHRILEAMGVDTRAKSPRLVEPLSERELQVLRLVASGLSNREIAEKLVISPGTAKTHIHNLCGKLGVRNRTEAAMRAKELQLA